MRFLFLLFAALFSGAALAASISGGQDPSDGAVSGGTAAFYSKLMGGIYNSSAPTLTNGQQGSLQLTAGALLKVDGSGVTQPVSAASLPLPTGAATSALQTTGNSTLTAIDAGIPAALGQTTMSASMPVTVASDQSTIPTKATIKSGGLYGNLSVGTSAVEVKVGGSKLTGRRLVTIFPVDRDMWWGYSNAVTTSTGTPVFKSQFLVFDADDTATIYLVTDAASKNARISESP